MQSKNLLALCFCFFMLLLQAQNKKIADSLIRDLPNTKTDSARAMKLSSISYYLQGIEEQKAMTYAQQALTLSKKIGYNDGIAEAYRMIGFNYRVNSYDKAIAYYKKGLTFASSKFVFANLYMGLGLMYTYKGDYKMAMKYNLLGLKYSEAIQDNSLIVAVSINIGIIYYDLHNLAKALEYYKKALKISEKDGRKSSMSYCYGNLGNVYSSMGQNDKAIIYYEKAAAISVELGDDEGKALSLSAIGDIYFQEKQYEKALDYVERSLVISRKANDFRNVAYATAVLGDIQLEMGGLKKYESQKNVLLQKSISNFNESTEIQKEQRSFKDVYTNFEQLSKANALLGNFEKALDLSNLSIKYKDSIYNEDTKETVKSLEDKRTIELRDKQILLNKLTIQSKEKEKWLYIVGIAFLIISAGFIYKQSRNRKKNNEKLLMLNTELDSANKFKARFFGVLNHDLRSPVASLISFLHLKKDSPDLMTEESRQRMENKTILAAENLLESMEDILQWSKSQMENFKPQPTNCSISNIFADTKNHFSSDETVTILFENQQNVQLFTDENYLKTIIRNLTGNAIKALDKIENPTIVWKAWQEDNHTYLSITDNGSGASQEQFKALYDDKEVIGIKSGLGLHLIRDLAKAIDCEIAVDSSTTGTTFTLYFK